MTISGTWGIWNRGYNQRCQLCVLLSSPEGIELVIRFILVPTTGKSGGHASLCRRASQSSQRSGRGCLFTVISHRPGNGHLLARQSSMSVRGGVQTNDFWQYFFHILYLFYHILCVETGGLLRLSIGLMQAFSENKTDYSHLLVGAQSPSFIWYHSLVPDRRLLSNSWRLYQHL